MQTQPFPKRQRALTRQRLEFVRQHLDKTDAAIAGMLGLHRSAVHQLRGHYKIRKVHGAVQLAHRIMEQLRALKPGLSSKAAAAQLGLSIVTVRKYGPKVGYKFRDISHAAARHFYWRERIKSLPPRLTVTAVARELGVTYAHAALLCVRNKYQASLRTGAKRTRVPVRNFTPRPQHEHWLASLKPAKL